jgi:hypothetical protein
MKKIKTIIKDYKLKLKIVEEKLEDEENDIIIAMLSTKASCYKTFIKDLKNVNKPPFQLGDIVVWSGNSPCICRLQSNMGEGGSYYVNESHNSLHHSHLRLANSYEVERLGDKKIVYI